MAGAFLEVVCQLDERRRAVAARRRAGKSKPARDEAAG